jgi:putative restriction endonuclease
MTATPLSLATRTRLQKLANDTGFDIERPADGTWLAFDSTSAPMRLWLSSVGETVVVVAISQTNVVEALKGMAPPMTNPLPAGAAGAFGATSFQAAQELLHRSHALSRTLPDELLQVFRKRTAGLPQTTEAERMVRQRVGQDVFREGLLEFAKGRCMVTGIGVAEVLRASHIKAWAECASDAERLDVYNGLLLAAHLDALFDKHLISVADDGWVLVSEKIGADDRQRLGLDTPKRVVGLTAGHRAYLSAHRARFEAGG